MDKETKNWLDMVDYDLITVHHMFKTGRYLYVIFMCRLAIEKIFKAIVYRETNKLPPKTHDLIYLLNLGKIKVPDNLLDFIGMINNTNVVTRYPEDLPQLIASYPKKTAKMYLDRTLEVIKCTKQDPRLKE